MQRESLWNRKLFYCVLKHLLSVCVCVWMIFGLQEVYRTVEPTVTASVSRVSGERSLLPWPLVCDSHRKCVRINRVLIKTCTNFSSLLSVSFVFFNAEINLKLNSISCWFTGSNLHCSSTLSHSLHLFHLLPLFQTRTSSWATLLPTSTPAWRQWASQGCWGSTWPKVRPLSRSAMMESCTDAQEWCWLQSQRLEAVIFRVSLPFRASMFTF